MTCPASREHLCNMAAEERRIQRIVREIVSSEIGEPNLPTNVQIYQSNREAPVNTGAGFQNVNEELRCRFQIPRRFPANGDRECALSPLLSPNADRQAPQQQIASSFNPSFNYGGRMNRRRPRRQGTLPYSQGGSRRTSCTITSASCSPAAEYYKDVILLPSPTWMKVPRGNEKSQLQKRGCYVDAVRFSKVMSEDEVKSKITDVFQEQLVNISGNPVSFTFVKSCGSDIVSVKMESSRQMTGDILKHVVGQGAVYVMASRELSLWSQPSLQESASSLTGQECSFLFSRTSPTVESTSVNSVVTNRESNECQPSLQENTSTVTGQQCSFSSPTGEGISEVDSVVTSLQQIFPSKSREELVEITRSTSTLEEATNKLLDNIHAENPFQQRERQEASFNAGDDLPLHTVVVADRNPFAAMNMFRNQILKRHLPRQIVCVDRQSGLVVKDFFKMLKRGEVDVRRELDVEFLNEEGIDASGLTKEYLNLLMTGMANGTGGLVLFEGAPDHLLPIHKEEYLQSGYFGYVGKTIALSVVHGGVGFLGMSRALVQYLITGEIMAALPELTLLDVPDLNVQMCLEELESAPDDMSLQNLQGRDDMQLLLTQAGFVNELLTMTSKARAVQYVLLHQVFKARRDEIDAIRMGMDSITLTDFLLTSQSCIPLVFPLAKDVVYTAEDVLKCIKLDRASLSVKHIEVAEWFQQYIEDLESEPQATVNSTRYGSELSASPTLKQLIQFIFGDPILPRNTNIKIGFRANRLPDADACFGIVHLPLQHEEYRSFRASMNTCINCQYVGYGRG